MLLRSNPVNQRGSRRAFPIDDDNLLFLFTFGMKVAFVHRQII